MLAEPDNVGTEFPPSAAVTKLIGVTQEIIFVAVKNLMWLHVQHNMQIPTTTAAHTGFAFTCATQPRSVLTPSGTLSGIFDFFHTPTPRQSLQGFSSIVPALHTPDRSVAFGKNLVVLLLSPPTTDNTGFPSGPFLRRNRRMWRRHPIW